MSYRFINITACEYYGQKYFTYSTQSSAVEIADIGSVLEPPPEDSQVQTDTPKEYDDVCVIGVARFNRFEKCLYKQCKGKITVSASNPKIGTCNTCHMLQRVDKCDSTLNAKIVVEGKGLPANLTLYATDTHLAAICGLPQSKITN